MDVSMGFMDLEFDPDKVKCTVDDLIWVTRELMPWLKWF